MKRLYLAMVAVLSLAVVAYAIPRSGHALLRAASLAAPFETNNDLTITFTSGTTPATIVLGSSYTGPATPSQALYDAGDGNWTSYTSNTITLQGDYVAFRGDWRTSAGIYESMFENTLAGAGYECEISGTLEYAATADYAYREMFLGCSSVVAFRDNPFQPIVGEPTERMFHETFYKMDGLREPLPDGFMDTSQLIGAPQFAMFYRTFNGVKNLPGPLPENFFDTSGLTGAPTASMMSQTFYNTPSITGSLPENFFNLSGLTGAPATRMLQQTFYNMANVSGSLPENFLNTSGLTGAPATFMFSETCYRMLNVTGDLPDGFLSTANLTGAPAAHMYNGSCYNMGSITGGDIIVGANITLTSADVGVYGTMHDMRNWTGQMYWGTNVIHTVLTPDVDTDTFKNCFEMPGYDTLDANWK